MNTELNKSDTAVFTVGLGQKGAIKEVASEYAMAYASLDGFIQSQNDVSSTFREFLNANLKACLNYSDFANQAKEDFLSKVDDEQPTQEQWADDSNWYRLLSHVLKAGGHQGLNDLGGIAGRDSQGIQI